MKILVTGDREWTDWATILYEFSLIDSIYESQVILVHGNARGADRIAGRIGAKVFDWGVIAVPADWATYGKAAGPVRNQMMLDQNPDISYILAFHDDLWKRSKGTKDMVLRGLAKEIPTHVFHSRTYRQDGWTQGKQFYYGVD